MDFILNIIAALGLVPSKDLAESMRESKTLTLMVIIGLVLFGSFALFLFHMAGKP
ncbi:hypothetical protein [uncultured Shewanella sp.]|uniref:hypothetical protein n=1 Tax=uncultured Shewanella sp. TaxID=173975 RepID=UPI002624B0C4|nr:hypothetical protein [uncultured Shewanella sp.]